MIVTKITKSNTIINTIRNDANPGKLCNVLRIYISMNFADVRPNTVLISKSDRSSLESEYPTVSKKVTNTIATSTTMRPKLTKCKLSWLYFSV